MTPAENMNCLGINWRKVDWGKVKDELDVVAEKDGGYDEIIRIVDRLGRKGVYKKSCGWWNKELEKIVKEVKFLRRSGDREAWKLARKVLRNRLINERYDYLKRILERAKDPEIFKAVKTLDAKRVVPAMTMENGTTVYDHSDISDLVAEQLKSNTPRVWQGGDINWPVEEEEVARALKGSPTNTASGNDDISYPFLRFWFKNQKSHMTKTLNNLIKFGYEG